MQKNTYKPRYKIAFQAKSIIWPYKNSRLRRFFNIRGRKIIRRGNFKRYFLVMNSMKWVIARRFIQPYKVLKTPVRRQYKKLFYTKQQIRHFYGKVKEQRFRNFFKKFLSGVVSRNRSFYSFMELRLDMVVFRLKFMPTIYAAHQLVLHHGILVNKGIKTSPNQLVRVGDIIALSKNQWKSIFCNFYLKSFYRSFGKWTLKRRQKKLLKKKSLWLFKRIRSFKRKNLVFLRKTFMSVKACLKYKKRITTLLARFDDVLADGVKRYGKSKTFATFIAKKNEISVKFNKMFARFWSKIQKLSRWQENQKSVFVSQKVRGKEKTKVFSRKSENKSFLRKWRWGGYYKKFVKWISSIFVEYRNLYIIRLMIKIHGNRLLTYIKERWAENRLLERVKQLQKQGKLKRQVSLEELRKHSFFQLVKVALRKKLAVAIKEHVLFRQKLNQYYLFFLRTRLKKKLWRSSFNDKSKTIRSVKWRAALSYFMIYKRLKKKRRLLVPRLKKVHWYFPQYFHFDVKTLRGVVLRAPMSNEVFYSFRGSLSKVYSFYKSRGY